MRCKVISKFALRDGQGNPTGQYAEGGSEIELNAMDAERLFRSDCIVPLKEFEVERQIKAAPENQMKRGRKRSL